MLRKKRGFQMQTLRRTLTTGGTLLTALLIFTAYAEAKKPKLTTLHSFQVGTNDGYEPQAGVVIGENGVLYGTTLGEGTNGSGAVYSLTPPASPGGQWTETTLYTFQGGSDGANPYQGVVIGSGGVLYGTTPFGGNGFGTVFSLTPPASPGDQWTETVLYRFQGGTSDGSFPGGSLAIGKGGVLYGTTETGGAGQCTAETPGCGTVFSLTPPASPGDHWTETVLHSFTTGGDGLYPVAWLVIGKDGVLYGTTANGGTSNNCGTVFELAPPRGRRSTWTETILHSFGTTTGDGCDPEYGGLVMSDAGVLSGTTHEGGTDAGYGTVFSLTPPASPGSPWAEAVYAFNRTDGAYPWGNVAIGKGGVLYGTTWEGGTGDGVVGYGVMFSLTPSPDGGWTETVLHSFRGTDGAYPWAGVVVGKGGVLYGTTYGGGTGACGIPGCGTVFSLNP
jgi:uncharacterized repeat protein (TIGR03803 family)